MMGWVGRASPLRAAWVIEAWTPSLGVPSPLGFHPSPPSLLRGKTCPSTSSLGSPLKLARRAVLWQNFQRMIRKRLAWFSVVVVGAIGLLLTSCSKSPTPAPTNPQSAIGNQQSAILKFHWLGKQRLALDPNATNFMAIWNLPESAKLEAQTLDKLATAPWRLWQTNTPVSNAPTAFLRPLLEDMVQAESYLEVHGPTNQPGEFVFAIRLSPERAALWATNLPIILESFAGASASPSTFNLQPSTFRLSRSGDWTLLSASCATNDSQPTALIDVFRSRLAATQNPFPPRATNYVLETEVDLPRLSVILGQDWPLLTSAHVARLVVFGDGQTLRTRGWVDFSHPLALRLDPWNVPTNVIQSPLIGFSALRGVAPFLQTRDVWKENRLGTAPDQFFFWSQKSAPWLHFFAARSPEAGRQFLALKDYILDTVNLALAPNRTGDFAWLTNESRVVWKGVPFCSPVFEQQGDLIIGGFSGLLPTRRPMPVEYIHQLQNGTNLVYYDWEMTDAQVPSWTQIGQLMRMAFGRSQLSIKDAGLPWLNTVGTNLSYTVTTVTLENDHRLAFARAATLGLNSVELHLLVDWLDSPGFPVGLHTFVAPREYVTDRTRPRR